jgi:hypothetical protein
MMVIVEKLAELRLAGETEVLGENLPQRHLQDRGSILLRNVGDLPKNAVTF